MANRGAHNDLGLLQFTVVFHVVKHLSLDQGYDVSDFTGLYSAIYCQTKYDIKNKLTKYLLKLFGSDM